MSRNLDNWINAYLNYTQDSEAPRVFHWWAAASTIASVLQGKVWIDMGDFVWKPNFYIIFVAPPGVANKSTTLNIARRFSSEMVDEKGNPSMAYGPDSGTWQGLMDALVDVSQQYTIGGETTYMSAITSVISELGTFLRSDDFEKIDTLVNLWDNPPKFTTRTRGGGLVQVTNPCLNIIGATTPDWVRKNFPEYGMFGGFTSRVMFIHAAAKSRLIAYPGMGKRKEGYTLRKKLLDDLQKIHRLQGADGLDGLAILPTVMVAGALGIIAYATGHVNFSGYLGIPYISGAGEIVILCGSIVGAGLGFLWFNTYPAQVFMGDIGALALGAALGVVAVVVRQEIVLLIMGGVFVVETVSVILQVASFKLTGKRVFRMAPLHHHFELKGWPEPRVIVRFWVITVVLVLVGLATLKIR